MNKNKEIDALLEQIAELPGGFLVEAIPWKRFKNSFVEKGRFGVETDALKLLRTAYTDTRARLEAAEALLAAANVIEFPNSDKRINWNGGWIVEKESRWDGYIYISKHNSAIEAFAAISGEASASKA